MARTSSGQSSQILNINYERFAKQGDILLAGGVVTILFVMLIPLPTIFLDFMLTVSISLAMVVLITAMFMTSPWNSPSSRPCSW